MVRISPGLEDHGSILKREVEKCQAFALVATILPPIEIESFFKGKDFSETLTRAKFEDLCSTSSDQDHGPCQEGPEDSKVSKAQVDEIVLVGGSTRIPKIQSLLCDFFDGKELDKSHRP